MIAAPNSFNNLVYSLPEPSNRHNRHCLSLHYLELHFPLNHVCSFLIRLFWRGINTKTTPPNKWTNFSFFLCITIFLIFAKISLAFTPNFSATWTCAILSFFFFFLSTGPFQIHPYMKIASYNFCRQSSWRVDIRKVPKESWWFFSNCRCSAFPFPETQFEAVL